jgi:biopolymer transport protein ExbD
MSQRVTEDMKLPVAEMVKEDPKAKEGYETTTVNLVGENDSWFVKIAGHGYPNWDDLKLTLHEFAQASPDPANVAGQPFFSSRAIMLRADELAPYKHVQRIIQLCSAVGLYKIEVVATRPDPQKP